MQVGSVAPPAAVTRRNGRTPPAHPGTRVNLTPTRLYSFARTPNFRLPMSRIAASPKDDRIFSGSDWALVQALIVGCFVFGLGAAALPPWSIRSTRECITAAGFWALGVALLQVGYVLFDASEYWRTPRRVLREMRSGLPFNSERMALAAPFLVLALGRWSPAAPVVTLWAGAVAIVLLAQIAKMRHSDFERLAKASEVQRAAAPNLPRHLSRTLRASRAGQSPPSRVRPEENNAAPGGTGTPLSESPALRKLRATLERLPPKQRLEKIRELQARRRSGEPPFSGAEDLR